jgi:hypothetical protein
MTDAKSKVFRLSAICTHISISLSISRSPRLSPPGRDKYFTVASDRALCAARYRLTFEQCMHGREHLFLHGLERVGRVRQKRGRRKTRREESRERQRERDERERER